MARYIYCSSAKHLLDSIALIENDKEFKGSSIICTPSLSLYDYLDSVISKLSVDANVKIRPKPYCYLVNSKFILSFSYVASLILYRLGTQNLIGLFKKAFFLNFNEIYTYHDCFSLIRLLSLTGDKITLIEDGTANYCRFNVLGIKKYLRKLCGLNDSYRVMGEEDFIKEILLTKEYFVCGLTAKKVTLVDKCIFTLNDTKNRSAFFYENIKLPSDNYNGKILILTQPIESISHVTSYQKIECYRSICNFFGQRGYYIGIKLHPREKKTEYLRLIDDLKLTLLPHFLPAELLEGDEFNFAISINSSFCHSKLHCFNLLETEELLRGDTDIIALIEDRLKTGVFEWPK
ncbi:hypothetical protein P0F00_003069 [Vibrio metschnikovii]|nr:hypothetical protein [Vibrio metschnikovii]